MEVSTDKTELLETIKQKREKTKKNWYIATIVACCVIIITLLILNLWQAGYLESDTESETVTTPECTGNGHKYNDLNECECFQCFYGENCENEEEDCSISAGSGTPYLLIEYWAEKGRNNKIKPMVVPIDYRMPYDYSLRGPFSETDQNGLGGHLNQMIRRIHAKYHNVNTTDSFLVFGAGGTQLQTATYAAYSTLKQKQIIAFDEVPYYFGYINSCWAVGEERCVFNTSKELIDDDNIVEFVTYPNNPDGFRRERVYTNSTMWAYDLVYYWPHYFDTYDDLEPLDAPISYFSATKLSGHAGSRFGWAFVKNHTIASSITNWLSRTQMSMSVDAVRRGYEILSYIEENGDDYFDYLRERMKERWDLLLDILADQNNYILSSRVGTFFAWIECVNKTEEEIMDLFENQYSLRPTRGSSFGQPGFIRIGMALFEGTFEKMMTRLRVLVDAEK